MKNQIRGIIGIVLCLLCSIMFGQDKRICITIDDLPAVTYSLNTSELDFSITNKLIATFKKYDIPAIGYVCEGGLYRGGVLDSNKVKVLEMWLENGYDLGNHTFSHFDYNKVSDSTFFKDVLNGEEVTKPLMKKYGKELKYFRHPYLHTGADSVSSKKLEDFLRANGYQGAPITIDNEDYLFAKAYHNAHVKKDDALKREIGRTYVKYMKKKLLYFESKSKEVFGHNITQTLLIHASLLNADYLGKLAKMYQKQGYSFINQEETLETVEYASPISSYSKRGNSWIFRWGMSQGRAKEIMNGDVETPINIVHYAKD